MIHIQALIRFQDSRNVPQHTKDKMRALDTNIKADFIKQDRTGSGSKSALDELPPYTSVSRIPNRPCPGRRSKTDDSIVTTNIEVETSEVVDSSRKSRPRSRTFTLTKGDSSPSKKPKPERPISRGRPKSTDLTPSIASSLTAASPFQALSFLSKAPKPAVPEEYIFYLRKVQNPESVEVGKIQKLRQLLRNETVTWVDIFITRGGMAEIVGLLNRIIQVEWRYAILRLILLKIGNTYQNLTQRGARRHATA